MEKEENYRPFVEAEEKEDIKNILGVNEQSPESPNRTVSHHGGAETFLSGLATFILVAGCLGCLILLIVGFSLLGGRSYEEAIGIYCLLSIIPALLSVVTTWALLRVIVNISNNLHDINRKIN